MENSSNDSYFGYGTIILAAATELVKTVHDYISDWLPTQDTASPVRSTEFSTDWN